MLSSDVACVFMPSGADSALLDASSCLSSLHAWHAVVVWLGWLRACASNCLAYCPLNYVPSVVRRLGLNSGSCVAYLLERNQTLSLPIPCRCSLRGVGRTMKSSMCPTAASLRCVVVVDHVGVLVLSVAEHNVERSAPGVHRSARPFYRRCAPGLNWPGRASGAVTLKKLECSKQAYALDTLAWDNIIGFRRTTAKAFAKDVFINQERKLGARRRSDTVLVSTINDADQGLADVTYRTPPAPYEKSKSLGSGGSMVARLKLKGIDGRAPPGVEPAA
uniref:rRNA intron-encoded homing endonuclease n=1 Tax=Fagus sylvatica TaxID=28930 RepID=A0A2N9I7V3_FAGSY